MDYNELAKKFGSIPSGLTKKTDIVPAYLSEEEFAELQNCPREGTIESRSKWPTIGGRKTYPLSGVLNREEKDLLNYYTKEYHGSSHEHVTRNNKENSQEAIELRAILKEKCPEVVALFDKAVGWIPTEEDKKEAMMKELMAQLVAQGWKAPKAK